MEFKPSSIPEILQSVPPPPSLDEFCAAEAPSQIERLFIQFLRHTTAKKNQENSVAYPKQMKRSYPREYKLKAIQYFKTAVVESVRNPGVFQHLSKRFAAKKLGITPDMLRRWLKMEDKIRTALSGSRWISSGRNQAWPELEARLFTEFSVCRAKGKGINHAWVHHTSKRLFAEIYPDKVRLTDGGCRVYESRFSRGWFRGFKQRCRISWSQKTKQATKSPIEARPHVEQWLRFNRRNSQIYGSEISRDVGRFFLCDIYNMDQTPLPFEFLDGRTYDFKGNKTIWVKSIRSGWSKRQATLMITACADGVRRCNPLIIF